MARINVCDICKSTDGVEKVIFEVCGGGAYPSMFPEPVIDVDLCAEHLNQASLAYASFSSLFKGIKSDGN